MGIAIANRENRCNFGALTHLFSRARKKDFPFFLWGNPAQNCPQNTACAGCLFYTRKTRSEVPERGDFGKENCLGKGGVDRAKKRKKGCINSFWGFLTSLGLRDPHHIHRRLPSNGRDFLPESPLQGSVLSGTVYQGGTLTPGERHSRVTRDDGTVTLCALRAATVLSRDCCADFGRPLTKVVMLHSSDGHIADKHCTSHCGVQSTPPSVPPPPLKVPDVRVFFCLCQPTAMQRCNVNFLPDCWVESWKVNLGGEFLEGEFFFGGGPLLLGKTGLKFDPRIRASKICFAKSAPNSGSGGAKSPVQKFEKC